MNAFTKKKSAFAGFCNKCPYNAIRGFERNYFLPQTVAVIPKNTNFLDHTIQELNIV